MIIKKFSANDKKYTLVYQGCSFVVVDADGITCVLFGKWNGSHWIGYASTCALGLLEFENIVKAFRRTAKRCGFSALVHHIYFKTTPHLFIPNFEVSPTQIEMLGL